MQEDSGGRFRGSEMRLGTTKPPAHPSTAYQKDITVCTPIPPNTATSVK
jgi:hypothetical protein